MKNPSLHPTMASTSAGCGATQDETAHDLSRVGAVVSPGRVALGHQRVTAHRAPTSDLRPGQRFPELWPFAAEGPVAAALGALGEPLGGARLPARWERS